MHAWLTEIVLNRFFAEHAQPKDKLYDEDRSLKLYPKRTDFETFVNTNPKIKAFAASLL